QLVTWFPVGCRSGPGMFASTARAFKRLRQPAVETETHVSSGDLSTLTHPGLVSEPCFWRLLRLYAGMLLLQLKAKDHFLHRLWLVPFRCARKSRSRIS